MGPSREELLFATILHNAKAVRSFLIVEEAALQDAPAESIKMILSKEFFGNSRNLGILNPGASASRRTFPPGPHLR